MRKIIFYFLLLLTSASYSQATNWHYFVESKGALKMTTLGSDIWISTNAGLIQFNKNTYTYSLLDKSNSPLPSNFITAMDNDGNGNVWAAVNNKTTYVDFGMSWGVSSLLKFNGSSWTEYNQSNSPLPEAQIIDLKTDTLGNVWSVTDDGQLIKYDNTSWTIYDSTNSPLLNTIYCMTIDPSNNVWIGTFYGVYKFDGSTWTNYNISNSPLLSDAVFSIQSDNFGKIWMGSVNTIPSSGGLSSFDGSTWNTYVAGSSGLPVDWVNHLTVDNLSTVWLNADASGLTKFDGTSWQTFNTSNSGIISDYGTTILSDSGVTWFGAGVGLSRFDGTTWQNFDFNQVNMSTNRIYSSEIDGLNNKYMSTDLGAGLIKYDNSSWTVDTSFGFTIGYVESDSSGHLWTYVSGSGIGEYDGTTWQIYNTSTSAIPSDNFQTIFCDDQNNKWMGGYNGVGLVKYDGTTWTTYDTATSAILSNSIISISQDTSGKLWTAHMSIWDGITYSVGGISSFDGTSFTSYDTSNSGILSNHVIKVLCDQANNVWVATLAGLSKFDGSTWNNFPISTLGLDSSCYISSLAIDVNNILWVGTNCGLVSYDGITWNIYSEQNSGLPMNSVSDVQADMYGNKWIAFGQPNPVGYFSGYGITVFNENGIVGLMGVNGIQEQIVKEADCNVFPNPFTESATIEIKNKNHFDYCDLQLFDIDGKMVLSSRFTQHSFQISRNQLKAGMYFYSILSNDGKALGKGKIIIVD